MNHPLSEMLDNTMDKVHHLVDANTVVGDPIHTPDNVTIIPVSKVSFGYAGGGSDFTTKTSESQNPFGGGTGGSVKITPVAFLIVKEGNVRVLPVAEPASSSLERIVDLLPELMDKLQKYMDDKKQKKAVSDSLEEVE